MDQKELSLQDLSHGQLVNLKNQLEQEITLFKQSFSQLRLAQQKFTQCLDCVDKLESKSSEGEESLIPVTNSLFLKGTLLNSQNVMIDIGTGYWMEKSFGEAASYYKTKVTFLVDQLKKVSEMLNEKIGNFNTLTAYVLHLEQQSKSTE